MKHLPSASFFNLTECLALVADGDWPVERIDANEWQEGSMLAILAGQTAS
jgi:hypothetical protein